MHSDLVAGAGELCWCYLRYDDANGVTRWLTFGAGQFNVGSGQADVIFGMADPSGGFAGVPTLWSPAGHILGAATDLWVEHYTPAFALVESQLFAAAFTWDPISQLWQLGKLFVHDPMLDDILASVRRTY